MADFGKTTDGASETCSSTDRKKVSLGTATTAGTISSITFRSRVTAQSGSVIGVMYSNSIGTPGAIFSQSDPVVISSTTEIASTLSFTGTNIKTIAANDIYWIGFHQQDPGTASHCISRANTGSQSSTNTDVYSDGPASPFGAPTLEAGPIDCYVTYNETTGWAVSFFGYKSLTGVGL